MKSTFRLPLSGTSTLLLCGLLAPAAPIMAAELVNCVPADEAIGGGDNLDRSFYIDSFPGFTLGKVYLWIEPPSGVTGEFEYELEARLDTFDGPLVGTATASYDFASNRVPVPVVFDFEKAPISFGRRVTFDIEQTAPAATSSSFYSVATTEDCPIIQTNSSDPPLSSERREGISVIITGDANPPTATIGRLENPQPGSTVTGIGLITGWACEGQRVEVEIDGAVQQRAAYGTSRQDTVTDCGDADNGFGLLFNWNLLGAGEHSIRLLVDGFEIDSAVFNVVTLGQEFRTGLSGTYSLPDFPDPGERVIVEWQESLQDFGIVEHDLSP